MRLQRSSHQGTIVPGVILGLVIGLAIAAFIAWTWNREPSYNERVRSEQDRLRAEREREVRDRQGAGAKDSLPDRRDADIGSNKGLVAPDKSVAKTEPSRRPADDVSPQDRERFDFYKILPGIEEARPVTEDERRRERDVQLDDRKDKEAELDRRDKVKDSKEAKDLKKKKRSSEEEEQLNQVMSKIQDEGEVSDRDAPRAKPKRWMMQAGAFENEDEAERLKADLAMSGMEARVLRSRDSNDLPVYRVRLGPFVGEEEVGRIRSELKRQGIKATTIPMKEDHL